eukprot:413778-Rhodomonas_salina.3
MQYSPNSQRLFGLFRHLLFLFLGHLLYGFVRNVRDILSAAHPESISHIAQRTRRTIVTTVGLKSFQLLLFPFSSINCVSPHIADRIHRTRGQLLPSFGFSRTVAPPCPSRITTTQGWRHTQSQVRTSHGKSRASCASNIHVSLEAKQAEGVGESTPEAMARHRRMMMRRQRA